MPIRVKCPNPNCNRSLTLPDEHAGKKGKCPRCDTIFRVPEKQVVQVEIVEEEYEEDYYDEHEDRPRKRGKKPASKMVSIILFAVGMVLLIFLIFIPLFSWISVSMEMKFISKKIGEGSVSVNGMGKVSASHNNTMTKEQYSKSGTLSSQSRPEGLLFLIICVIVTVIAGVGFGLGIGNVFGKDASPQVASLSAMIGTGAGIMFVVWIIAWIWKVVSFSGVVKDNIAELPGGTEKTISTYPGLGLFLGVAAALGAAYIFSFLASRYTKSQWVYLADGIGLLLGLLVLLLVVQPWGAEQLWNDCKQYFALSP